MSNIDLLKSADINNQTVGGYKNSSPTDEKTISLPFNKSADENATNNTQSIFVSPFSCSWDHKLPNITQNIDLKKDITAGTYYLGSSIKIKNHESQRSAILLSKHNTENVVRNGNFNALLSSLQKNKTFCNSDRKSEENLAKDISQVLSTEDYTYCKKGSTSHEEVLTSGIILSTQPKLQFNAKKNFKHGLQSSECFVIKNKVSIDTFYILNV